MGCLGVGGTALPLWCVPFRSLTRLLSERMVYGDHERTAAAGLHPQMRLDLSFIHSRCLNLSLSSFIYSFVCSSFLIFSDNPRAVVPGSLPDICSPISRGGQTGKWSIFISC